MKITNTIYVDIYENNFSFLKFPDYNIKTIAYIGKNGATYEKREGDGKTPLGKFYFGFLLGTHPEKELSLKPNMPYTQIHNNLYCIDDVNSKYYNHLVDITKITRDWTSAEHLIDFPIQYEYLIEIKANPYNIPGKGSAIFLHCSNNCSTGGCVAIDKNIMKEIIFHVKESTKILIRKF